MKCIKITIALFVFTLSFSALQAQKGKTSFGFDYTVALPMATLKDHVSATSFRGVQASVLYGISNGFSIGFGTGFQDFYQKDSRQLYKLSDGRDISAVVTHSIQTIPLLAEAKYRFAYGAAVQPYVALGVGGNLISYSQLLGEFGAMQTKFGFAARPEAGLSVPFRKNGEAGLTLGASYNIMSFNQDDFSDLNHLGLHAGVRFPLGK